MSVNFHIDYDRLEQAANHTNDLVDEDDPFSDLGGACQEQPLDDDTLDEVNLEVSKHVIDESDLFLLDYVIIIKR